MKETKLFITILAGGLGKRMNSMLPKILHEVNNKPMLVKIIEEVVELNPEKIIIIVGQYKELIKSTLDKYIDSNYIEYIIQEKPLGTGNAVYHSLDYLKSKCGINLILNGDTPLLKKNTICEIIENYKINNNKLQITAIELNNPTGNGRIILKNNIFERIIEEKDCNDDEKKIKLINCGIYLAEIDILVNFIPLIKNNNAQKEYYLTDIVEIYKKNTGNQIGLYIMNKDKELEIININTKEQLDAVNQFKSNI